jgi:plasmid stabilization system protein ParE
MKFTVVWKPQAEQHLAHLWTLATDRAAVSRAADAIDSQLLTEPQRVGESREELQSRLLVEPPLAVAFRVREQDRVVEVLSVWVI